MASPSAAAVRLEVTDGVAVVTIDLPGSRANTLGQAVLADLEGVLSQLRQRGDLTGLVFRSGKSDLSHTRATSEWVHRLVPHSLFLDPPWDDDEWNYRSGQTMSGPEGHTLFRSWPKLVPQILDFIAG